MNECRRREQERAGRRGLCWDPEKCDGLKVPPSPRLPDKFKAVLGTSSGGSFLIQTLFVCDSPGELLGAPHQQDRL